MQNGGVRLRRGKYALSPPGVYYTRKLDELQTFFATDSTDLSEILP